MFVFGDIGEYMWIFLDIVEVQICLMARSQICLSTTG